MNNYQYDKPLRETYFLRAVAIDTDTLLASFVGPKGRKGRIVNFSYVLTVAATVADTVLTLGPNGDASPVTLTVPFTGSAIGANDAITNAQAYAHAELAADTNVELVSNAGSTAGDADIAVTIEWY